MKNSNSSLRLVFKYCGGNQLAAVWQGGALEITMYAKVFIQHNSFFTVVSFVVELTQLQRREDKLVPLTFHWPFFLKYWKTFAGWSVRVQNQQRKKSDLSKMEGTIQRHPRVDASCCVSSAMSQSQLMQSCCPCSNWSMPKVGCSCASQVRLAQGLIWAGGRWEGGCSRGWACPGSGVGHGCSH